MSARARRPKTNIVSLHGGAIPIPRVNVECVKDLEWLMDRAEGGYVAGIVWGIVSPEGHVETGYAGNGNANSMVAASSILAHRIAKLQSSGE